MMSKNDFIKLETNSVDEHGPIYVYISFGRKRYEPRFASY